MFVFTVLSALFTVKVPRVCSHLVDHGHHGHRLLHRRLRLDDGDVQREVEDLPGDVHELLLASQQAHHSRTGLLSEGLALAPAL